MTARSSPGPRFSAPTPKTRRSPSSRRGCRPVPPTPISSGRSGQATATRSSSGASWSVTRASAARASTCPAPAVPAASGSPPQPSPPQSLPQPDPAPGRPYGRRAFLAVLAGGLSSLVWGAPAWRALSSALRPATGLLPEGVREIVPTRGWRIYTVGSHMPTFERRRWRLRVDGLVARSQVLSYDDLLSLPSTEQTSDF